MGVQLLIEGGRGESEITLQLPAAAAAATSSAGPDTSTSCGAVLLRFRSRSFADSLRRHLPDHVDPLCGHPLGPSLQVERDLLQLHQRVRGGARHDEELEEVAIVLLHALTRLYTRLQLLAL